MVVIPFSGRSVVSSVKSFGAQIGSQNISSYYPLQRNVLRSTKKKSKNKSIYAKNRGGKHAKLKRYLTPGKRPNSARESLRLRRLFLLGEKMQAVILFKKTA